MQLTISFNKKVYSVALASPLDISIPVRFDGGSRLRAFGAPSATAFPYKAGDFVGDVKAGGSCNCGVYSFSPHLHGTHTECVGHITGQNFSVHGVIRDSVMPATVVSIVPEQKDGDLLITRAALEAALAKQDPDFFHALVLRTIPNGEEKKTRDYGASMPPYFTADAMRYIVERGVQHLLVDMPSVDRLDDGGKLAAHRIFWGVEPGVTTVSEPSPKTITELIYVPDAVKDGAYMLNLQVAAFEADAAPSRPLLYECRA